MILSCGNGVIEYQNDTRFNTKEICHRFLEMNLSSVENSSPIVAIVKSLLDFKINSPKFVNQLNLWKLYFS